MLTYPVLLSVLCGTQTSPVNQHRVLTWRQTCYTASNSLKIHMRFFTIVYHTKHFEQRKQAPNLTFLNCQSHHNCGERQFGRSKLATNMVTMDWAMAQNEMLHFLVHNSSPASPPKTRQLQAVNNRHTQQLRWKPGHLFLLLN